MDRHGEEAKLHVAPPEGGALANDFYLIDRPASQKMIFFAD
jgi:hypothetical protein